MEANKNPEEGHTSLNFIEEIVKADLESGKHGGVLMTRFPPEPNGYLHIGHAKSICLNFQLAQDFGGKTNLRFDDTNPVAEDQEYVDSIKGDIQWLGFSWDDREYYASDYFDQLFELAQTLIRDGKAFVDDCTVEEIREMRGVPTRPGTESPYRNRTPEENLDLFERMKNGEYKEGEKVLRAKIDMSSPNMHMRDPILYRILYKEHHRTGNKWCIYPMYDWAHGQSDAIEGITHSICTLEFEVHRPLYEWFLDNLPAFNPRPRQYEFARLNLTYTMMSKRNLKALVTNGVVSGWDDPRMPTISGFRRRGYTPESIRTFAKRVGVTRQNSFTDLSFLEFSIREDLNKRTHRVMAVLDPVKLVITNWPAGKVEMMELENNPEDENAGNREVPFSGELYIERDDFMEEPPKKFFRLGPDLEVRLKGAYIIQCESFVKDSETGMVTEIHCTYDPETRSGSDTSGKKVKGTIHWVSVPHALKAEVRLYDRLFTVENPLGEEEDYTHFLNPNSLVTVEAMIEPELGNAQINDKYQFMRNGYFCVDSNTTPDKLVFNRTVTLKDTWAKANK